MACVLLTGWLQLEQPVTVVVNVLIPVGLLPGVLVEFQHALFYSGDELASFYHPLWNFSVKGGVPAIPANDTVNQDSPPVAVARRILKSMSRLLRLWRKNKGYLAFKEENIYFIDPTRGNCVFLWFIITNSWNFKHTNEHTCTCIEAQVIERIGQRGALIWTRGGYA